MCGRFKRCTRCLGTMVLMLAASATACAAGTKGGRPPDLAAAKAIRAEALRVLCLDPGLCPSPAGAVAGVFRVVSIARFDSSLALSTCAEISPSADIIKSASMLEPELIRSVHGQHSGSANALYFGPTERVDSWWSNGANVRLETGDLIIAELGDWIPCPGVSLQTIDRLRVYDFGPAAQATDARSIRTVEALYRKYYRSAERQH